MRAVENAEAPPFRQRLARALRPSFRPRRRDFACSAGVVLLALPLVVGCSWTGHSLAVAIVLAFAQLIAGPIVLIALLVSWKRARRGAHVFQRVVLQTLICVLATVPLFLIGAEVTRLSVQTSMRRGDVIVAELERYRKKHRVYPRILEGIERDIGRTLPRPSIADEFYYDGGWWDFRLGFCHGIMLCQEYDSRKGCWSDENALERALANLTWLDVPLLIYAAARESAAEAGEGGR